MAVPSQHVRYCTAADGTKIAYALSGDGLPLVMSATWLTHLERQWQSMAWRPWLDAFSPNHQLLRYDPRGCGLSDRHSKDFSFDTWVSDFETVIEASGLQKFDLLATCWGGSVAIEYAARHPERVNRLVLYGTYALGRLHWNDTPEDLERSRLLLELMRLGWGQESHAFVKVWALAFQPEGTTEHLRSWSDQQSAATTVDVAHELLRIGWNIDVRESARKIQCPVLVVHADKDLVVPIEQGRLLASLIAGSRFAQIDTKNHMPLADEPAWSIIVKTIRDFLGEADPLQASANLPLDQLTARERAVLEKIADGMDNAEIASALDLSEKTVRNHITRVFDKIGVAHRYEAIVRARDAGLGSNNKLARARRC